MLPGRRAPACGLALAFGLTGLAGLALSACGGAAPPKGPVDKSALVTSVQLSAFEVRDDQVDRFEHCPPAGEIGQDWLPPIPEWHPSTSAAVPESAVDPSAPPAASPGAAAPLPDEHPPVDFSAPAAPASLASLTGQAVTQSRGAFRRCYHQGLLYDPTQDGRVGVVLHVDHAGKVASVETWGACDLTPAAIVCMRDEATHLKLPPPADGAATVVVPAVFTSARPRIKGSNDAYAAAAYVAVESMRPRLHNCADTARRSGGSVTASADFTVDINRDGAGVHVGVDQYRGNVALLACAAEVVRDAPFPKPPAGQGRVIVPLVFNPRPGTR